MARLCEETSLAYEERAPLYNSLKVLGALANKLGNFTLEAAKTFQVNEQTPPAPSSYCHGLKTLSAAK